MAKARALIKRRKAIRNLRKITHTMNLIATTRYQKNMKRIQTFRPFAVQVRRVVGELIAACPEVDHPLLHVRDPAAATNRIAVIVLTSDRGLCGSFNTNVLRVASQFIAEQERAGKQVELYVLGHKGVVFFAREKRALAGKYESAGGAGVPTFEQVRNFSNRMMEQYLQGHLDEMHIALTRFVSAGRQSNEVIQILPVRAEKLKPEGRAYEGLYDLSPDPQALLDELLPIAVQISMFQALLEAATSEQFIRMVSMKSATENADRLIKSLTMKYNRARQSQITTELCEIMGAVEAMK